MTGLRAGVIALGLVLWPGGALQAGVLHLPPPTQTAASCKPDGTNLSITAFDQKFNKDCLAAPATQAFTVEFQNLDRGIPHNLAIYQSESADKEFFKGDLVDGPGKSTYSVPGIPAGTWFFRCDPHPDMKGAFIAG